MSKAALFLFSLALALVAGGCTEKNKYEEPPPPSVTVILPVQKEVVDYLEFTGTTQAVASVDIRARVQGFLESVKFKEGAIVKKGDLLYTIESSSYQAAVDKAVGDLASKKAQLDRTEVEYQRNLRLMKENATSERDLNNSKAARDSAKADVMVADANLDTARINLGYTSIRAPLAGRIGRNMVDVGNLVGAGEFTLLATIKQYHPMYSYFTLNEHDLLRVMKTDADGKPETEPTQDDPVFMGLANESGYPHEGRINFADLGVDQTTGTILLRGIFPNPRPPYILPGLFVRLRAPLGKRENVTMVPERAIGVDQVGKYLLVVDKENTVQHRPVRIGVLDGNLREIQEGLKADERVILNGLQRARPGAKVTPTVSDPASTGAPKKN